MLSAEDFSLAPANLQKFVDGLFEELESPHVSAVDLPTEPMCFQPSHAEKSGDQIGRYTLIEILGEGGFGSVWRAEQSRPVRREVALKIIKLGMDTREVIARFEAERQALAVLDHPNIAKVFDAGATPTGRPYFVMELVRGAPLTKYCNEQSLPLTERLMLFAEVCRAVQHAHQKGIIHRDLKPSNLLVTLVDGNPVPKVIDFGIAKATGESRLTENTLVTRMDRLMGTPAYMSPEQAEPGMDIDTRTDIYSLGVVLYELLTGQVPFQIGADGKAKRERDAQRPSTRIKSFTAEQLKQLGALQRVEGPKLTGLVKGDLDWIAMKALEQDRARRYDSANAFADDVLAFLHQQPVSARPTTTWYLLTRFTQRNKLAVGSAAAIVLVLVGGITTTTWMYFEQKRALVRSEQVSKFLKQVLEEAGPSEALGRDTTMLREILDKTAERIGTELSDQPAVQAELRAVLGQTYNQLQEYELALKQTSEVLRILRATHNHDDLLAAALIEHGDILEFLKRSQEAMDAFSEALAIRRRLFGEDDLRTIKCHEISAWTLMNLGRKAEAEAAARIAMEHWRKLPDQGKLLRAPRALAMILHRTNRHEEALAVKREELAALHKVYGEEHPQIYFCLDNLGYELCCVKRYEEAEAVLIESLRQSAKFLPLQMDDRKHVYDSLLRAVQRQDWAQHLQYARDYLKLMEGASPPAERGLRAARTTFASALMEQADHFVTEAWKLKAAPEKALAAAATAHARLDELSASQGLEAQVKTSGAWLNCLRGYAWMLEPEKNDEGKALLLRGIEALKKKDKPTAEDTRRLKKAEAWLVAK